ncbi:helix-turn-helix domain-containing protein [Nocardia sp. NPDC050712]|uniref:TetR/AcrR family transcriptional regulator n=1 Tax=Nocardia sp. NPDC050712 TaxID=3155518 RepID=UPI00341193AD
MNDNVKDGKRRYHAPQRAAQAAHTRHAILDAARSLFVRNGYTATTVSEIARDAGVSVDTVYASIGRKPVLLRELVETALSGTDQVIPAQQRDYVRAIGEAPRAEDKIAIYVHALAAIQQRLAPIFLALRDAAATDASCARVWAEIGDRRARNMREFAADLRGTGQLRADLSDDEVADILWSMNATEYWVLLVGERGWTPERFRDWVIEAWTRSLLIGPGPSRE